MVTPKKIRDRLIAATRLAERKLKSLAEKKEICAMRRFSAYDDLVVFDLDAIGTRDHYEPVLRWLLNNSLVPIIVAVPNHEFENYVRGGFHERFRDNSERLLCTTKRIFRRLNCIPAVTVSLHPENGSPIAETLASAKTQRVVMQHGLSDKSAFGEINKSDPMSDFDVVFLIGPVFREGSLEIYKQKNPETFSRLIFKEIGSPKTDVLFAPLFNRSEVLIDAGLDPSRPTVCYGPTWENCASLETAGIEIIRSLAELDVNVIAKLHPVSLSTLGEDFVLKDGHGGKDWRGIISDIEREYSNVKLAKEHDAVPYLVASDLLVSDASGIAYEFLLLNKPLVFFDVPLLFSKYGKDGIHYWGRDCGDIVKDVKELKEIVIGNLNEPNRKKSDRDTLISRLLFTRGDATQKAGEAILSLAECPRTAANAS